MAEINFNNSKSDNYIFSTKLSLKSLNRRRSSEQEILMFSDDKTTQMTGNSSDKDKYIRPVLDVYFDKSFKEKHEITINAVGTYYKSDYNYQYSEMLGNANIFNSATDISTNKYSFIGDAMYSLKLSKTQLFLGARYMYNGSKQKNIEEHNKIETNEVYSYIGATEMFGKKVNYNVSLGIEHGVILKMKNEEKDSGILNRTF